MNRNNKNYAQAAAQSKTHNNNTHHQNQQHHHQQVSQQNQTSGNSTSSNFSSSANGKAINKSKPQAQHNSTMGNGNTGRSTSIKQKNPVQLPMNGHAWEKKTTIEFGSINTPNAQISSSTSTGPALTSGGGLPTTLPTKGGPTFGTLNTTTQTTQATQAIPTTVGTSGPGANNNNSNNNSNNNNNNGVAHKPISARAGEIPRTHSAPPQIQDNNRNVGQSNYLSNVPATRAIHQQQQSTVVSHQQPSASVSNTPLNHRKDSVSSTVSSNDGQPPFHPHHSPHHAHNTHHHYGRHHNHKPNMGPPNQYRPRDNKNVTHPSPHLNPAQSVSTQGVPMAGPQMWPPQYSMQMPPFYGYPPVHNVHNPMFIPQHTYAMQPRPPIQQPHLTQVPTVNYKPPNISTKKSQAIEIIDPNKNAPIQYVKQQQSQLSKSPHKREEAPPAVFDKKPEESDKEKPSSDDKGISRAVPIVDPAERERKEREEQERITKEKADQERKEREEKERVAKEKEEQERREREERERKEREEKERIAKEKEEQERREREERERKEREERERKEREERERKEREERERKEREERERKEREEQERIAKEKAEQERKEREEKERIAKEKAEQERKEREEKERIAKEKEEQERREREEREKREREEKERIAKEEQERKEREEKERIEKEEKERKEAEKARKEQEEKEEIERKKKEEEEARIKATAEDDEKKKEKEAESNDSKKEEKKYGKGHRPGPLDLSRTTSAPAIPSAPLSALGSARAIDDINSVQYPEGISSPNPALNSNAEPGKFKYDRSFLMQFMGVCKEKPENLPALEAIGMEEPKDDKRNKRPSVSRSNSSMHKNSPQFPMGEFKFPPKTSEERFAVSNMRNGSPVMFGGRTSLSRTGSGSTLLPAPAMSGTPSSPSRTSSGRGTTRKGGKHHMQLNNLGEPVAPLERSENRWVPGLDPALHKTTEGIIPIDSVKRKVKALLNKLTLEKFDSISDQIVDYANKSRDEKDGRILREVIRLIFEKSCDESNFCAMYAQLCRKMMERVDPEIVDENVKNTEGKFVQGGTLFRKYLLNRCQEDFEKGWKVNIPVPSNEKGEPDLMSDEYYVAAKAKRQGLGLIRFIGELFKLNMLTERIMHECIKKLLIFQGSPEEEEMESLCKLMNTVGEQLDHVKTNQHEHIKANQIDHAKAKQLMESYFARMDEISKLPNLSSRIKFMIMDVIDLRSNAWKPRRDINAPKTIAEIHEDAAKQKEEAEFLRRSASSGGKLPKISEQMSRSGSGRRDHKGMTHGSPGNDGWINVGGNSSQRKDKVGDLTKFGSVSRGKITGNNFSLAPGGLPLSGGAKGWKSDNKDRDDKTTVLSRTNSTSNMYSVLTAESSEGRKSSESSTSEVQKPSPPTERKRIILAPRTKAITPEEPHSADKPAPKSNSEATSSVQSIPDESIKKINNMMEEYFSVLDIQEVLQCLKEIPAEHHARAIESFANKVLEKKQKDVDNVTKLFKEIVSSGTCDVITFKSGFKATLDFLMDIGADAPMSYSFTGQLMFGAGLDFRDITKLLTSLDDDKSIEKIVRGYTSALKNDDEQKYVQKINEFDFKTLFPKKNKDDINKYLEDLVR